MIRNERDSYRLSTEMVLDLVWLVQRLCVGRMITFVYPLQGRGVSMCVKTRMKGDRVILVEGHCDAPCCISVRLDLGLSESRALRVGIPRTSLRCWNIAMNKYVLTNRDLSNIDPAVSEVWAVWCMVRAWVHEEKLVEILPIDRNYSRPLNHHISIFSRDRKTVDAINNHRSSGPLINELTKLLLFHTRLPQSYEHRWVAFSCRKKIIVSAASLGVTKYVHGQFDST